MIGREVTYTEERWEILREKRRRAKEVMGRLREFGIHSIAYGSIARGDVKKNSDVDIFIPYQIPSYKIEIALEGFEVVERRIVQATPNYAIKGEIVLTDETTVSFPLVKMRENELDFYRFGGCLSYGEILRNKRVAGVDKRLFLIIPTERGHREVSVFDVQPSYVAKVLNVSLEIVEERIRVLTRRREIGRTGIFLQEVVPSDSSFEAYLDEIAKSNPMVRKRIEKF